MSDRERKIRERAYSIWESEAQGEGDHLDHWLRAEKEIDALVQAEDRAAEKIVESDRHDDESAPAPILSSPD